MLKSFVFWIWSPLQQQQRQQQQRQQRQPLLSSLTLMQREPKFCDENHSE
jgi:hypothetical protein